MVSAASKNRSLLGQDFFDRAQQRLTLEVPAGLTDPNVTPARGDHDADPVMRAIDAVRPIRPAAVLVPIVDRPEPTVLLTQRTTELSSHAGQIAFPGGKIDPIDESPLAAALREADEEIGLDRRLVHPIGYLDLYMTSGARRSAFRADAQCRGSPRHVRSAAGVPDAADQSPAPQPGMERHGATLLCDPIRRPLYLGRDRRNFAQPARPDLPVILRVSCPASFEGGRHPAMPGAKRRAAKDGRLLQEDAGYHEPRRMGLRRVVEHRGVARTRGRRHADFSEGLAGAPAW